MSWSDSYHGVQHRLGIPKRYQATVEDHGTFVDAYILDLQSEQPFSKPLAEIQLDDSAPARDWVDKELQRMGINA